MMIHLSSITDKAINGANVMLADMHLDSRKVQKGDLFCALKGAEADGHDYIAQAIENGAAAIVMEQAQKDISVSYVVDAELSQSLGNMASRFYASPSQSLYITAVTGTNGKSSVCSYIYQLSTLLQQSCGEIGTLGVRYQDQAGNEQQQETMNTTPDAITLQQCLAQMRDANVTAVAMEVSSHALDQGRCNGIALDAAIFTNLSHDHLDYHGTLQAYAEAKMRLFSVASLQLAIVNADDALSKDIEAMLADGINCRRFSIEDAAADYYMSDIELSSSGISSVLHYQGQQFASQFPLLGRFNCQNILAAIAVMHQQGYALSDIVDVLPALTAVDGRMQMLENKSGLTAVVDYAHTPDALKNVLSVLREITAGDIHLVFGCGGERDQDKRVLMAEIAETMADHIIVTADNPRREALAVINADIARGFKKELHSFIDARGDAIATAVNAANDGDVVLIAGKGHETYQLIGDQRHHFDDVAALSHALMQRQGGLSC